MGIREKIKNLIHGKKQIDENSIWGYEEFQKMSVSKRVKDNKEYLSRMLQGSKDIIYRNFSMGSAQQHLLLVYLEGMADTTILNDEVLQSTMLDRSSWDLYKEMFAIDEIKSRLLTASEINEAETFDKLILQLLSGDSLLFVEGASKALIIGTKGWEKRNVSEPTTETNVKGPKDCFVETLRTNIVLIRRRIRDPNLTIDMYRVGRRTKSDVAVVYLKDVLMEGLAEEIKRRIEKIDIDGLVDTGQLENLIEDHQWTIFPQTTSTERPDRIVSGILEGRAAIVMDGSPFVLMVPSTFAEFLGAPDDYFERPVISSVIRTTRYISYFLSASLPGIYIALTNFHPGMLPPALALSITSTRVPLPFSTFVEIFVMEAILEILQEAGVRLPNAIGATVGIVGGIVIGQAVVEAGLVSPVVVIIVSLTAITSFTMPSYSVNLTSRVMRVPFMVAGATLGFFGIVALALFILTHMASLESFGIGYFESFSPYRLNDLKDTLGRVPMKFVTKRPEHLKPLDTHRQDPSKNKGGKKDG